VDGSAVLCPLCTYDLRGLIEPRCPECGYRFVWAELLDQKRNTHPYLFEHHPRNNVWSFVRTAIGGLNPIRFWRTLRPQMTVRPGRLFAYWMICTAMPALLGLALIAASQAADYFFPNIWQGQVWAFPTPGPPVQQPPALAGTSIRQPPVPPSRPAFADVLDQLSDLAMPFIIAAGLVALWSTGTTLTLLIFQQSMQKAQIRRVHVYRCVGYSFDVGRWIVAAGALASVAFEYLYYNNVQWAGYIDVIALSNLIGCLIVILAAMRLWAAYRLYLGFDHAFWVVLSSQIIVGLAFATVALNLYRLGF
jgi:hypothetical protein